MRRSTMRYFFTIFPLPAPGTGVFEALLDILLFVCPLLTLVGFELDDDVDVFDVDGFELALMLDEGLFALDDACKSNTDL